MKKKIFFCWVWLSWLSPIMAQINNVWQQIYDYQGNGASVIDIDFDSENNIILGVVAADTLEVINAVILKYTDSNLIWQAEYSNTQFSNEMLHDICIGYDNSIVAVGWTENNTQDYLALKYNANGTFAWSDMYDVSYEDFALCSAIDSEGYVYVGGHTQSYTSYVTKYSPDGVIVWRDTLTYANATLYALKLDEEENIYVSGTKRLLPDYTSKPMLYKMNRDGQIIWADIFDNTTVHNGRRAILNGFLENNIPIVYLGHSDEKALIAYNPLDGTHLWEVSLPNETTYWSQIALNPARDHIAVIGKSNRYLRYYDALGNLEWHVQKENLGGPLKVDVQIAPNGVIYWLTRDSLYAYGSDGALLHSHTFEGMEPNFIRFDHEANLYVVGSKDIEGSLYSNLVLEKYAVNIANSLPELSNNSINYNTSLSANYMPDNAGIVHFNTSLGWASIPTVAAGSVLRVYDIWGREVHIGTISDPTMGYSWPCDDLSAGIYVAVWECSGQVLGRCRVVLGK